MTAALLKFLEPWRGQAGTHEVVMVTVADEFAATLAAAVRSIVYGRKTAHDAN